MSIGPATIARGRHFHCEASPDFARGTLKLSFFGTVDEESDLDGVWQYIARIEEQVEWVDVDLSQVERVNSAGVRSWMIFAKRLQSRRKMRYQVISEAITEQAVFMPQLLGKSGVLVEALTVPYYCNDCSSGQAHRVELGKIRVSKDGKCAFPGYDCKACARQMDADLDCEQFKFLIHHILGR